MQRTEISVEEAVFLSSIVFVILGGFIILVILTYRKRRNAYHLEKENMKKNFEQEILKTKFETQEETFNALGKELHDNVGQLLNSAKLLIGITQRKPMNALETLSIADETLATAINELRALSKSLNKEWLERFNFIENLGTEIKRINASAILQVHLSHTENLTLKSDEQIVLFRIVQEALQNAIKHAHAENIYIFLKEESSLLSVIISDDGCGFEIEKTVNYGLGINNMLHRTKLLNGFIQWHSSGDGTTITIQLPVKPVSP